MLIPDFIDPIDAWIGRMLHGPMHRFSFKRTNEFSGADVEMLLRRYGVRVWGREFDSKEELALLVKKSQASWAEYVLCRAGVPLTCKLVYARNAKYPEKHKPGSMPKKWATGGVKPHTIIDHIVSFLYRL